jgi:uncharacterized protein YpmS
MKVIVYANWREEEILTEKEYKEKIKEVKKDKENFNDYKSSYLNDYIEDFIERSPYPESFETVFNLTETERQKILDTLKEGYDAQVEEDFSDEWEEIEIDI